MSILRKNFKISVWDDVWDSSKGKFVEKRIGVIGSHDMTSPCRALEPNLTRNVNGTKKFSFKMYKYCRDEITGEKILNPFSEWLVNERKVKLERDGQTYDFLIKNIQETSANYLYTYTLEDANITELSKNGYSVVLDTKAENNLGTLEDLAGKVLLDTDWEVESEKFVEKIEEGLVYLKVNTAFSAKRVKDQGTNFGEGVSVHSTVSIPKDSYILGFYSSCVNRPYRFQFLYFSGITNPWYQETEKVIPIARNEKRIVDVENCQYYFDISAEDGYNAVTDVGYTHFILPKQVTLFNPSSLGNASTKDRYDTLVSSWYRGERYGYVQKQVYSAKLDKYLSVYGASGNIYGYNETEYHSPILINNTITSPGMDSTSGWKCAEFTTEVEKITIEPVQGRFPTTTNQFVSSQDELKSGAFSTNNKYQHYLRLTFPKNTDKTKVRILNTGIYDNRTTIGNFEKGDVWAFRCEYRIGNRDYSYPGSGPLAFDLEEYQYQTVQGVYQKEETQNITFTRANKMGTNNVTYETFTVASSGYNKDTFKKDCKIYISFGTNSSQGTDTVVYLKDMQLFKTQLTEDEKILPSMADMDTVEGTTTTTYKYFTSAALDAATSEEDLNILVKSDKPLNRDYPPYFVEGAQKVRTVNAKESNYFNILQSIAETFQAWLSLEVIRDESGAISRKIAKFKNYVGKKNYAGFRYGVNLKDIQRTFESNNLVTKLIVKPNKNKYGEGGFCTIQRAGSNETGENFIYDLQYYYNIGLLDPKVNNELLYTGVGQSGADISGDENSTWNVNNYFSRLKRINTLLKPINEELSNTSLELVKLKAKKEVADAAVKAAASGIQDVRSNFSDYTAGMDIDSISFQSPLKNAQLNTTKVDMNETLENSSKKIAWSDEKISSITISQTASNTNNWTYKFTVTLTEGVEKETTLYFKAHPYVTYTNNTTETLKYTIPCVVSEGSSSCTAELIVAPIDFNSSKIQQFLAQYAEYLTTDDEQNAALTKLNADIADVEEKIETLTETSTRYLDWKAKLNLEFYKKYSRFISEGTWVDEKYSDDEKYYNDALSVLYNSCYPRTAYTINVAAVEGVEGYEDYTFDIGDQTYVFDPQFFGENAREPVIVAEITEAIDNPSAVQIKVQNFKNQFQDLFQKITATVQSVQYSTGAYEKAAALAEAGQPQKYAFLSDALDDAEAALQVAGQQTVITDGSGITVHKEGNNREALRLVSGAILFSTEENGEQKWKTGITPKGISADLVTAGQIDTGAIRIMNGKDETFKWDTNGITAYDYEDNALNKEKFVRLDRHGLYGVDGTVNGDIYTPGDISQVDADSTFALTWEGLKVTGDNGGTARIGKQRKNSKNYIMVVKDAEGKDTLRIDEAGHLELRESLTIGDMGDDEKTFSEYVSNAADAAETNAKNYADTQIDNIEIGGRNLAANNLISHTATVNNSFLNGVNLTADTEYGGTIFSESLLKAGQEYTLSFRFQKTAGTLINFGGHNTGHTVTRATLDGEVIPNYVSVATIDDDSLEHYVTITFKTESNNKPFYIQLNRARETSITYDLWDIKIEKGSKATDWTPAPEDIAADITATNSLIEGVRDNLQSQIDGEITSWFYAEDPTTTNPPANGWTTENEKIRHEGDLYYNTESGAAYRWVYFDDKKEHGWTRITDEAIAEALAAANTAKSTADGKMTVFVSTTEKPQPTPPYQIGDLWVNATYPVTGTAIYSNDLLRCKTQKAQGASFDIEDWELASKYTDNTELENFIDNTYEVFAESIQEQVDAKAEIYYQGTDPADYEGDDKWGANQVGDLWRCTTATTSKTSTLTSTLVSRAANSEWIWKKNQDNSYGWHHMEIPDNIFDAYDGKATLYTTKPGPYKANDLWILDKQGKDSAAGNYDSTYPSYEVGTLLVATTTRSSYSKGDWTEKTKYTDDTAVNNMQIGGKNLFIYANKGEISDGNDWNAYTSTITETDKKYRWNVSTSGNGGFKISEDLFEVGKEYICSYHYKKTSGKLNAIGGHSQRYTTKSFIIDGVNKGTTSSVNLTDETDPTEHFVEWHFIKKETSVSDNNLYIQLNRSLTATAVAADIWDLQIEQGTKRTAWRPAEEDLQSEIDAFTTDYESFKENIQGQVDSKAETWYTSSDPSTNWSTDELKQKHVGDLWHDTSDNKEYIWQATTSGNTTSYDWVEMEVPDIIFDELDGKNAIYTSLPNSYLKDDVWILDAATQATVNCPLNGAVKYSTGTLLVATTTKDSYDKADWVELTKYTDDTAANAAQGTANSALAAANTANGELATFRTEYNTKIGQLDAQLDGKAETWYQSIDPSGAWTSDETKLKHVGDLWYYNGSTNLSYTENDTTKYRKPHSTWVWTEKGTSTKTYQWEEMKASKEVFDKIDGKSSVYTSVPTSAEHGDILIPSTTASGYVAGKVYRYIVASGATTGSWQEISYPADAGRNILKNTEAEKSNNSYNIAQYDLTITPKVSDYYTISFQAYCGTGVKRIGIFNSGGNVSLSYIAVSTNNSYQNYSATFQWKNTSGSNTVTPTKIYIYMMGDSGNLGSSQPTSKIKKVKLEPGTMASDWSVAPEDLQNQITTMSGEISSGTGIFADGLSQDVTKTALNNFELKAGSICIYADKNATTKTKIFSAESSSDGKGAVYMAGWSVTDKQLSTGTLGTNDCFFLMPKGENATITAFDSNAKTYKMVVGNQFALDGSGNLYCKGGNIAGWTIDSTGLQKGNLKFVNSNTDTLNSMITNNSTSPVCLQAGSTIGISSERYKVYSSSFRSGDNPNNYTYTVDLSDKVSGIITSCVAKSVRFSIPGWRSTELPTSSYTFTFNNSNKTITFSAPGNYNGGILCVEYACYYKENSLTTTPTFRVLQDGTLYCAGLKSLKGEISAFKYDEFGFKSGEPGDALSFIACPDGVSLSDSAMKYFFFEDEADDSEVVFNIGKGIMVKRKTDSAERKWAVGLAGGWKATASDLIAKPVEENVWGEMYTTKGVSLSGTGVTYTYNFRDESDGQSYTETGYGDWRSLVSNPMLNYSCALGITEIAENGTGNWIRGTITVNELSEVKGMILTPDVSGDAANCLISGGVVGINGNVVTVSYDKPNLVAKIYKLYWLAWGPKKLTRT